MQRFDPTIDYGRDVYLGKVFQQIRNKLQENEMPFPKYCSKCLGWLAEHLLADDASSADRKEIVIFYVEPSLLCNLACPTCLPEEKRKQVDPPYLLEYAVLEKILSDLQQSQVQIRNIHFEGHGEPLLNKQVWQMIRYARETFPTTKLSMGTNANGIFHQECVSAGLDEIWFAIDGVDQASYEPYRQRGDFNKAYAFMKNFSIAARQQPKPINTIWKYIVFAHNDAPEQLIRAQELAREAEVSELVFILTQLGPKSTRIVNLSQIPCINNGVKVNIRNFQADLNSVWQSAELARAALTHDDYVNAQKQVIYGATMLSRRFTQTDEIAEDAQAVIHELLELSERVPSPNPDEAAMIDHLKALTKKCTISQVQAKDAVIQRQAQEMERQSQEMERQSQELQRQAQEVECQAHVIQAMEQTLSWKITKPLRRVRNHPQIVKWLSRLRRYLDRLNPR